ncbi:MAG TPA: GldG family protein, partial [Verrucomicrobiae bacterium]|nr:GldG family protein [Verrucomicrobiae bacterium]
MNQNRFETLLYSAVGVGVMFVVMVALYIVTSAAKVRVDVTADKVHTLSPGTKKILARLNSPVTIRFYCTQGDNAMPPALRTYAQHIEDLLNEYQQASQGKLIIRKFDPQPDSDAEDSARLNGVEGQPTGPFGSDKIYLGIAVSRLDQKFVLPWLPPERERLLEYDISRAIARVVNGRPPVVGIMSALPVFGRKPDQMAMIRGDRGADPWAFVTELNKDFAVREIPMTATKIDEDVKVLLVVHPRDISDTAQYAIDQFVLRGGKLIAFLDPHAYFDQRHDDNQPMMIMGDSAGKSTLDKLLKAWGLQMDVDKVVADASFAGRNTQDGSIMPTLLIVTRNGIDENEAATSQIDNLVIPFAGAFTGKTVSGINESVLIKSTPNSEMVDSLIATSASEAIQRDFKPSNTSYALAVHLTGKFQTAFPLGAPGGLDVTQLKESSGNGEVVLVADTDMLNDQSCVSVQRVMGRRVIKPANGNLNFVQSLVELFSGDDDLISARSRASMNRPFTKLKDMESKAGRQWEEKIQVLETRQRETDRKIRELQTHKEGGDEQRMILSPEQQLELQN